MTVTLNKLPWLLLNDWVHVPYPYPCYLCLEEQKDKKKQLSDMRKVSYYYTMYAYTIVFICTSSAIVTQLSIFHST